MSDSENIEEPKENKASDEIIRKNTRQVWLTLLVMISVSCVGVVVLTLILWLMLKNGLPTG